MKGFILGIILGSVLTTIAVGAADYLGGGNGNYLSNSGQGITTEIRVREALESIDFARQNYLDSVVKDMGKLPCR